MAKDEVVGISADLLKEVIKTAVAEAVVASRGTTTEDVAAVAAKAATEAARSLQDQWWDEKTYPEKSVFNPLGEKDHPRPPVNGEVFWAGAMLRREQLTREEIDLINKVTPGDYWVNGNDDTPLLIRVINMEPSGSTVRRLNIVLPGLHDPDSRNRLPSMRRILTDVVGAAVPA
jgi:hypothetical protein